jgi:RNA polymerase sigma-70 factor (ECF subfamily)
MDDQDLLAERFEEHRERLRAVARRMLGSAGEAEDAVQETWLRLARSDATGIDNLGGWLTTVVARVCLDVLRARGSRPQPVTAGIDVDGTGIGSGPMDTDPEQEAVLADSVGVALLVVLETLSPPERLAFVLHDTFAVPFDEIASIIGCSPAAARQFASRGRRRVQGADAGGAVDLVRQREVVAAFLAASRAGDFAALLAVLAPDVVLRADAVAVSAGAVGELRGATAVAENLAGRAKAARPALLDGAVGLVWATGGRPKVVFHLTFRGATIAGIDLVMDPDDVARSEVELLDDRPE